MEQKKYNTKYIVVLLMLFMLTACKRSVTYTDFELVTTVDDTTVESDYILVDTIVDAESLPYEEIHIETPENSEVGALMVCDDSVYYAVDYIAYLYNGSEDDVKEFSQEYATCIYHYDMEERECVMLYKVGEEAVSISNMQCTDNVLIWQQKNPLNLFSESQKVAINVKTGEVVDVPDVIYHTDEEQLNVWQETDEEGYLRIQDTDTDECYKVWFEMVSSYVVTGDSVVVTGYDIKVYKLGDENVKELSLDKSYDRPAIDCTGKVYCWKKSEKTQGVSVLIIN